MAPWPFSRRKSVLQNGSIKQETTSSQQPFRCTSEPLEVPQRQSALLLHAIRQPYEVADEYVVPMLEHDHEVLVKVNAAGLNPIDWKAPDFNFGIPVLPYISGRELVGTVVSTPPPTPSKASRIRKGDVVIIPSTDYRDLRKAAFQEYAITSSFNTIRLPKLITPESGSILGVSFVAAVLSLGICMGVDFGSIEDGPDLLSIVRSTDPERLPADIRKECLEGIEEKERAKEGDFLVIWGGSSACAHTTTQIARLAGLKIVSVVDHRKHGLRLSGHAHIRPDLVVDSHDRNRAIDVVRTATEGKARFGFDTQGKDSAAHLLQTLAQSDRALSFPNKPEEYEALKSKLPTPPSTPAEPIKTSPQSHLIGLTGLPKSQPSDGVTFHSVPIKLFHEIPEVGEALCAWCERLLVKGLLVPPDVVGTVKGLEGINEGLDRLRRREISGGRLVAVLP